MLCRILNALKFDGTLHSPGAVVDLPDEIHASLPEGTVELAEPVVVADVTVEVAEAPVASDAPTKKSK